MKSLVQDGQPTKWLYALIFGVSLLVFSATSADRLLRQSAAPHFVYLADSFLHGQLENRLPAPNNNDWIRFEGKTYVCFPPVPAVIMMPFVALAGIQFNDVLFTLPFAALNVLLMFLVLQMLVCEGLSTCSLRDNLWLTALFGFGTVNFCCSVRGEVWLSAQVLGLSFTLLYILMATRARHPLLAGICLALAFDTRVNLAFTVGYFLLQLYFPRRQDGRAAAGSFRAITGKLALFALPILIVGSAQMLMNHARYHDVFEFGHRYLSGPAGDRIREHGMFAYHYLWWNLSTLLLGLPRLFSAEYGFVGYDPNGMSIFITTPVFFLLLYPRARPWIYSVLWATALPALFVPLLYQNSGFVQFGYRFALDVTPYLIMLLAVGRLHMNRTTRILIVVSILVNLYGGIVFKRFGPI